MNSDQKIVVIGAGPTGCALACFLRLSGYSVSVFDNGVRPDLIVGESLVPAAIPIIRRLGIETEVARVSTLKPGASLFHTNGTRVHFKFRPFGKRAPAYAYNIPRPEFDRVLRVQAEKLGVDFIPERARLTVSDENRKTVELTPESANSAGLKSGTQPAMLVDATGRTRLFSRKLMLPVVRGERDDVAYFAHYTNFRHDDVPTGQIIISILNHGWSWRIPLPDRLSVGVVLDKRRARSLGSTATERFERSLASEPLLAERAAQGTRISEVRTYSNYQQKTGIGYGSGWILAGDAYGFVDPMLSPGVFMALESASLLSAALDGYLRSGNTIHLERYSKDMDSWHESWQEAIEYLYDGRLLHLHQSGLEAAEAGGTFSMGNFLNWHYRRVIANIISGAGTRSTWQRSMLRHGAAHFLDEDEPEETDYAVVDA